MAVIGKIRSRSALLIAVIGIAMFLFILSDFLNNSGSMFGGGTTDVAVVNGKPVSYAEFNNRVEVELSRSYPNQPINDQIRTSVRNRLWSIILQENIMFPEYEELGISVSPQELKHQIVRDNPSPIIVNYFTDSRTGQVYPDFQDPNNPTKLDGGKVMEYVRNILDNPETADTWLPLEYAMKLDRHSTKYYNAIKKAVYTTTNAATQEHYARNKTIDFSYVWQKYSSVDDSEITFDESDLKAYYNDHKYEAKFKQDKESRVVEYVVFDVVPSAADSAAAREQVAALIDGFKNAENDTNFVVGKGETKRQIRYFKSGDFQGQTDSLAMKADSGDVIGPFLDGTFMSIAKIIDYKMAPDSVRARHILIKNEDTLAAAATADSIMAVVKSDTSKFAGIAKEQSEDLGSGSKGGDLGWFTEGQMVKPFNDACFDGRPGDIVQVESQFGIHIIEILEQTELIKKVKVGIVDKRIKPGDATLDERYKAASSFAINNNTSEAFQTEGGTLGIKSSGEVREGDKRVGEFSDAGVLVRWMYDNEVGTVSSKPFDIGGKYVVMHLTEIKDKGTLGLDVPSIREIVEAEVIREKKAERFINEMSAYNDLATAGDAIGFAPQANAAFNFASNAIPGIGNEHKLIGYLFSLNEGETSAPIQGENGVFMVRIDKVVESGEPAAEDLERYSQSLKSKVVNRVENDSYRALEQRADLVDNRAKFF